MFTKITMKNFKSFKNVEFDLTAKQNTPKNITVVYGVNGSGKTTLTEAFAVLIRTMETMQMKSMLNDLLLNNISAEDSPFKDEVMTKIINNRLAINSIEHLIKEYRMICTDDNMSLRFDFFINKTTGYYYIEMDSNGIVKEILEYKLDQRRGVYFSIEDDNIKINEKIFESKEFYSNIIKQTKMYWGKHSFLSILLFEMSDKSDTFVNSNISINLMNVLALFKNIVCRTALSGDDFVNSFNSVFDNMYAGEIPEKKERDLQIAETTVNNLFVSIFDDIEKAYYKKKYEDSYIEYRLFLKKRVSNRLIDIDFRYESSGTKELLKLVPSFVAAASGSVVVIDEYGVRMHDLLSTALISALINEISGQLIITTHNLMIMEAPKLNPDSLYHIFEDNNYNKRIECVSKIENRLHPNYNYRIGSLTNERYAGAMPTEIKDIDLRNLVNVFNSEKSF